MSTFAGLGSTGHAECKPSISESNDSAARPGLQYGKSTTAPSLAVQGPETTRQKKTQAQRWRRARESQRLAEGETRVAVLAAELAAAKLERRRLVFEGAALAQTNAYLQDVQRECIAAPAAVSVKPSAQQASGGATRRGLLPPPPHRRPPQNAFGERAVLECVAAAAVAAATDGNAGGGKADAARAGFAADSESDAALMELAQALAQRPGFQDIAAGLVECNVTTGLIACVVDTLCARVGELTARHQMVIESMALLLTPRLTEYTWARIAATMAALLQLAKDDPSRREEVEAKLAQCGALLSWDRAAALRRRPDLVLRMLDPGKMLPAGPLPGTAGYAAAIAAGVPAGVNPVLLPALPDMALTPEQRTALAPAWETYQRRTRESRQELRAVVARFAEARGPPLSQAELDAMLLGRMAVSFLDTLGRAADLQHCVDTERFSVYHLFTAMLDVLTPTQHAAAYIACRPFLIDPVQLCKLLME
jgi:hypothetical protein